MGEEDLLDREEVGKIKVVETKTHIGEMGEEKLLEACKSICGEYMITTKCASICIECFAALLTEHGLDFKRKITK